jgi:hypothetical protein
MELPMILQILPILALALQERPAPAPATRATITIERFVKREDRVRVETGELLVRPGEALLYRSGTFELLIRDGRILERRAGERTVRAWDLARPENFRPLDLWRLDARSIRERFREVDDAAAAPRELPAAVVTAEGSPVPPVPVAPAPESLAWTDGVDRAEGCKRVILVPRDPALRSRIASIRLSVDRASSRLLRAVVDTPSHVLTLTLGDCREAPPADDGAFDWDLTFLKVEDR